MNVFVVTNGTYSDFCIKAIFSSRDKAEVYLNEQKKVRDDKAQIQEWILDEFQDMVAKLYWRSEIDPLTGEIFQENEEFGFVPRYDLAKPNERERKFGLKYELNEEYPLPNTGYIGHTLSAESYVSQEHANKLVVEARQKLLAKIGGVDNIVYDTQDKYRRTYYVRDQNDKPT